MPNFPSIYLELQELWKNVVQIRDVGAKPVGPATGVLRGLYPNPSAIGHVANRLYIETGDEMAGEAFNDKYINAHYGPFFPIVLTGTNNDGTGTSTAIIGTSGSIGGDVYIYGGAGNGPDDGRGGSIQLEGGPTTDNTIGSSVLIGAGKNSSVAAGGNVIINATGNEQSKNLDNSQSGDTVLITAKTTTINANNSLTINAKENLEIATTSEATTGNGDIEITSVKGDIELTTAATAKQILLHTFNGPINLSSEGGDININANSTTNKGDIDINGDKLTCEVVELDMHSFGGNKNLIFNSDKVELSSNNTRLDLIGNDTNLTSTSSGSNSIIINSEAGTTNVKGKSVLIKNENNDGNVILNSNNRSTITMNANIALNSTSGDVSISSGDDISLNSTSGDIFITGSKNVQIRANDGDLILDSFGTNKNIKLLNIGTDNTQQTALVIDSNNNVKKRVLSNSFYETYNRYSNFSTETPIKYEADMWDTGKEPNRYVVLSVNNAGVVTFEMHIFREDGTNIDLDSSKSGSIYGIPYTPQHGTAFGTISTYASSSVESSKGVQVAPCLIKGNRIYIGHKYTTQNGNNTDTIETGAGDLSNLYDAPRYIISATFIENAGAYPTYTPYTPYTPSLYE